MQTYDNYYNTGTFSGVSNSQNSMNQPTQKRTNNFKRETQTNPQKGALSYNNKPNNNNNNNNINDIKQYVNVETGIFQADMDVSINNLGPITILLESR